MVSLAVAIPKQGRALVRAAALKDTLLACGLLLNFSAKHCSILAEHLYPTTQQRCRGGASTAEVKVSRVFLTCRETLSTGKKEFSTLKNLLFTRQLDDLQNGWGIKSGSGRFVAVMFR